MQSRSARIPIIEFLRGLASISVALFHFSTQLSTSVPKLIASYGWLGVDVFFVISGVVVPLSLHGRCYRVSDFPRFMLRRLVRLEPPYLASIALAISLWYASSMAPGFRGVPPAYSAGQVASHLFYAIPLTHYAWINPVYWSLAYEFVFYIIVGLCFFLISERHLFCTVLLAFAATCVLFVIKSEFDVRPMEFLAGVLVMRYAVSDGRGLEAVAWIVSCLALAFILGGMKIGLAVSLAASSIMFLREIQVGRWAYWLGGISYSLYLTHTTVGGRVINLGKQFGDGSPYEIALMLTALAVSVVFAALFAWLIEAPAIKASRRVGLFGVRSPELALVR